MSSTPLPTEKDAFDTNVPRLVAAFGCGIGAFVLAFLTTFVWTRRNVSSHEPPEVQLIKANTRLLRGLCVAMLAVQAALVAHVSSLPDTGKAASYFDTISRPLAAMLGIAFGFSTNFHASFRVGVVIVLAALVAVDTVSEVHYVSILSCAKKGATCTDVSTMTTDRLQVLIFRDLFAIALELWALLVTAYLCVAVGACHSRYTPRQLSISNPYSNIRDLLAKHHPDHFKYSV
ncbi:unnamed protein product [Aphanomyces euteiches]|uniref:Uncharacterized protein n=2 Tax=Aphanomyces euteiches TaxID=100861 RepID=A0A6G0X1Z8_9STRA|nr:hypothetical protein Ae201684_009381 [Aphanomyces euteiches]KAH9070631.1 hypothetical protein Ae201684P_002987 [Aphanomyces euteiches]